MNLLRKNASSLPGLTRLRGRSPFGAAKGRQSIALCKDSCFQMDARAKRAHDEGCAS